MEILDSIRRLFSDSRFISNLIGCYAAIMIAVGVSYALRRLLTHCHGRLAEWAEEHWLHAVGDQAIKRARSILFVTTILGSVAIAGGSIWYHVIGRDVRIDLKDWYDHL